MEQTEQQLRQERDRFKAVLDAAPCRIMVKDSSGRQWYSNHSAVAGKTDALSAAEWDAAGWTEAERRALETGEPILSETVAGENVEMSYCFRVALPGENEPGVATMSASYPLRVKEDQEIKSRCLALEEQTRDAQEHVAALERRCRRLETRSEFLEAVVDQHPDGLFVFDRECRFTLWNAAMGRLTGKSVDDVLGRSAFEVFPNWAEGEEWECLVAAAEGKQQTLTSGGPPWHEYVYVPLRGGDENPVGGIAAVRLIANTGRRLGTSKRPSPAQRSGSMPLGLESPRHEPSLPATALVPDDAEWLSYN